MEAKKFEDPDPPSNTNSHVSELLKQTTPLFEQLPSETMVLGNKRRHNID